MAGYLLDISVRDSEPLVGRKITVPEGITFTQLGALINMAMDVQGNGKFKSPDEEIMGMAEIDDYMEPGLALSYVGLEDIYDIVLKGKNGMYMNNYATCDEVYGDHANALVISSNLKNLLFVKKEDDIEMDDFTVWEDASVDEWRELYDLGDKIEALDPWSMFRDTDLIALPVDEDYAYISIIGSQGGAKGLTVFFEETGLNNYFMIRMAERIGVDQEYVMFSQDSICAYWGNELDMLPVQQERVKALGRSGRGAGKNLYFMSFEDGYFPYDLERSETMVMIGIFSLLADALEVYKDRDIKVDFDNGQLYMADMEKGVYEGQPWPLQGFMVRELMCPQEAEEALKQTPHTNEVIEFDVFPSGMPIKMDTKPESPKIVVGINAADGKIVFSNLTTPDKITDIQVFETLLNYISHAGVPKRIKVANPIIETMIADLCRKADIDLRKVRNLTYLSDAKTKLLHFIRNGGKM